MVAHIHRDETVGANCDCGYSSIISAQLFTTLKEG